MSLTRLCRRKAAGSRSRHHVIITAKMFRLLSYVVEETPLHVQDVVRIPAKSERGSENYYLKFQKLSNDTFIRLLILEHEKLIAIVHSIISQG